MLPVLGDFPATCVINTDIQDAALGGAIVNTGQVGNNVLGVGVDSTGVLLVRAHVPGVVGAKDFYGVSGIVLVVRAEQIVQIAQNTGNTGGTDHIVTVIEDVLDALGLVSAQDSSRRGLQLRRLPAAEYPWNSG